MNDALEQYISALEMLTVEQIDSLVARVSPNVHFRDPFNDCRGREAYGRIMADMFEKLDDVEFMVARHGWAAARDGSGSRAALLQWTLDARSHSASTTPWHIEGCSEVRFDHDGLVNVHWDYWDAARHVYERLPIVGTVLHRLRRRISAT